MPGPTTDPAEPTMGRLVGRDHGLWLCSDHAAASWTPAGYVMPSGWRHAVDPSGRQRRPEAWTHHNHPHDHPHDHRHEHPHDRHQDRRHRG